MRKNLSVLNNLGVGELFQRKDLVLFLILYFVFSILLLSVAVSAQYYIYIKIGTKLRLFEEETKHIKYFINILFAVTVVFVACPLIFVKYQIWHELAQVWLNYICSYKPFKPKVVEIQAAAGLVPMVIFNVGAAWDLTHLAIYTKLGS